MAGRLRAAIAAAVGIALADCAHASQASHPASDAVSTAEHAASASIRATYAPVSPPEATFWSAETGRILVDSISGDAELCRVSKLYVTLANAGQAPMFERLITSGRSLAHVHIDDPTSGRMVYDLDGVVIAGKSTPFGPARPTFTLRFDGIAVTGCDKRRLGVKKPSPIRGAIG